MDLDWDERLLRWIADRLVVWEGYCTWWGATSSQATPIGQIKHHAWLLAAKLLRYLADAIDRANGYQTIWWVDDVLGWNRGHLAADQRQLLDWIQVPSRYRWRGRWNA